MSLRLAARGAPQAKGTAARFPGGLLHVARGFDGTRDSPRADIFPPACSRTDISTSDRRVGCKARGHYYLWNGTLLQATPFRDVARPHHARHGSINGTTPMRRTQPPWLAREKVTSIYPAVFADAYLLLARTESVRTTTARASVKECPGGQDQAIDSNLSDCRRIPVTFSTTFPDNGLCN